MGGRRKSSVIPLKQAWTPVIYKTNKTNFRISCYAFLFSGLFWSFDLLLNFWARHRRDYISSRLCSMGMSYLTTDLCLLYHLTISKSRPNGILYSRCGLNQLFTAIEWTNWPSPLEPWYWFCALTFVYFDTLLPCPICATAANRERSGWDEYGAWRRWAWKDDAAKGKSDNDTWCLWNFGATLDKRIMILASCPVFLR
jgi:hypothetical protein